MSPAATLLSFVAPKPLRRIARWPPRITATRRTPARQSHQYRLPHTPLPWTPTGMVGASDHQHADPDVGGLTALYVEPRLIDSRDSCSPGFWLTGACLLGLGYGQQGVGAGQGQGSGGVRGEMPEQCIGRSGDVRLGHALGPALQDAGRRERDAQVVGFGLEEPAGELAQ